MKCPNCYSDVAPAPRCPRCDWPLQAAAAPAPSPLFQEPPPAWDEPSAPEVDTWSAPGELEGQQAPGAQAPSLWGASPDLASPPQFGGPPAPSAGLPQLPFGTPGGAESVPLTAAQKTQLLLQVGAASLPFLFMGCFFVFAMGGSIARNPLFALIFVIIALVTGYGALQSFRDLQSGVALVRVTRLERSWRSGGKSVSYYGEFEGVGQLKLSYGLYGQVQAGRVYRVTYSPASKVVWSAQPY